MPFLPSIKPPGSPGDVFGLQPTLWGPFLDFCQELFRGPSPLPARDRETIFAYVSALNGCDFCQGGHERTAEVLGAAPGTVAALKDGIDAAPVDPRLKPLLRYVKKLTETPTRMVKADADAVYAAGWDEQALHHAVAMCALANFMNRLVEGAGIHADPTRFDLRAKIAVEQGYKAPFERRMAERVRPA
jgi:uncharacterized peroxidase-related enzyme